MSKSKEPAVDPKGGKPRQIVFKLTEENEILLGEWESEQTIKPNISALMNVALRAYLLNSKDRRDKKSQ